MTDQPGDPRQVHDQPGDPRQVHDQPGSWRIRVRALWRLLVVLRTFAPLALAWWRDRRRYVLFGAGRSPDSKTRIDRAESLLDALLELGPTFIKLGQLLSTRPDILPGEYIGVLSRLQDDVPPAAWERAEAVIEAELGPVETVFDAFDREAISGASLGQVYTAQLDGERVAVKVLRPDIRTRVEADLQVLHVLLPALVRMSPPSQAFTLENLGEEFAASIRREMDYELEAATLLDIRDNFADADDVRIPSVYSEYATDRVLTLEYVGGTKITDVEALEAAGVDRERVAKRLEEVYVQMIVEDGVFHADPHPGNLAVRDDGTLVFYDFGMHGRLGPGTRETLFEFYVGLAEEDIDRVIDSFIALDALPPDVDRELMGGVFEIAIDNFRGDEIDRYRVEEIVAAFQGTMREFPLRLPRNMALVVRVSSVLEGVCRTLDPEFDFLEVVREYVAEQATGREGFVWQEVRSRAVDLEGSLRRTPPKLDRALTTVERDDLEVAIRVTEDRGLLTRLGAQLTLGTATGGGVIATAALYAVGYPIPWVVGASAGTVAVGLLTRRSFRRGATRQARAYASVADRSLGGRKRGRTQPGRGTDGTADEPVGRGR